MTSEDTESSINIKIELEQKFIDKVEKEVEKEVENKVSNDHELIDFITQKIQDFQVEYNKQLKFFEEYITLRKTNFETFNFLIQEVSEKIIENKKIELKYFKFDDLVELYLKSIGHLENSKNLIDSLMKSFILTKEIYNKEK